MPTFVMLTRLDESAARSPSALESLERSATAAVRERCPDVDWLASYALLGPYDYIDLLEAPDIAEATRVSMLIRTFGHARTEVWPATDWGEFKVLARSLTNVRAAPTMPLEREHARAADAEHGFLARTIEGLDDITITAISILQPTYDELESAVIAWGEAANGADVPPLGERARSVFDILTNNMYWTADGKASMRSSVP